MWRINVGTKLRSQKGFTATELVVVIGIITILTTIASINMVQFQRRSRLKEAARTIEADFNMIRNTARIRQESNVVLLLGPANYQAFVDGNTNLVSDPTDTTFVNTVFTNGVQLAVAGGGAVVPPVTTVRFLNTGGVLDTSRTVTVTVPNETVRSFRVTIFTTGITRVERSDDSGATWVRAW